MNLSEEGMQEFEVMVTETSTYTIFVSAEDEDQAISIANNIAATNWQRIEDGWVDGSYEVEIA
jgi:uncharacterized protein YpbB